MAAYTDTVGFNKGSAASTASTNNRTYLQQVDLDFPAIIVARAAASLTALAASDSLAVLHIPAKTLILAVGVDCTTANTAASTIDIGYTGGDVDAWVDGFDTASATSAVGLGTNMTTAIATNYHASADTLDMLFLTALQAQSKMRIWAVMVDCS
jgi:hypothetical protein